MKVKSRNSKLRKGTHKIKSRKNTHKNKSRNRGRKNKSRKIKGGFGLGKALADQLAREGTPEYEVNEKINYYNLNPEERKIDEQSLVESLNKLQTEQSTIEALKNGITARKINYKDDTTLKGLNYDLWLKYHAVYSMPIPRNSWF